MHMMKTYDNLHDMLEKEVMEIEKKGQLDPQGLDNLYKLTTTLKNVDKCMEYEQQGGASNGRSYGNGISNNGSYNRSYESMESMRMMPWAYNEGMSNARRGRDGDGDGRYNESRDNFRSNTSGGLSNQSGRSYEYSRDNSRKKMIQKLETLMDDTMSENERQAIMDCINRIQ